MTDPTGSAENHPDAAQVAAEAEATPTERIRVAPPPGGPADPADRTVTPIAHPPVVLPPNPPPAPKLGIRELLIGLLGLIAFGATFLPWGHDPTRNAWPLGVWIAGVLALIGAAAHIGRYLPPADKAFGALLPLLLTTGSVWIPVAHLKGNAGTFGTWVCLVAGVLLVGLLIAAAMSDPALRSPDNPDDAFD
jgi:hypothetical protein